MVKILGLDIGGANTKHVFIEIQNDQIILLSTSSDYFPIWKDYQSFPEYLNKLKSKLGEEFGSIDQVVFVTTAELADCFQTKKEGIEIISRYIEDCFQLDNEEATPLILDVNGHFLSTQEAGENWLNVSATNWIASAKYLGSKYQNALVIDIGSTTTDFTPIHQGKIVAQGRNDLERLINKELVYSGLIRTNVVAIIQEVKVRNEIVPLASELFATIGDVYLLLGLISEEEYTGETADGKPVSKEYANARLARVVCSDTNQLTHNDIMEIARQIKDKQFEKLSDAMNHVLNRYRIMYELNPEIILIGSGANTIGMSLLRMNGIYEQIIADDILDESSLNVFCAFAVAVLYSKEHLGTRDALNEN
jgi:probable H4MPT-linked C1 transfer pathway protein